MHQLESMLFQLAPSQLTLLQDGPMPHAPLPTPRPLPLPMPTFQPPPQEYPQHTGSVRRNYSFPASVLRVLPFLPSYDFSKEPCVIEDLGYTHDTQQNASHTPHTQHNTTQHKTHTRSHPHTDITHDQADAGGG
jgi:hypothetical protein